MATKNGRKIIFNKKVADDLLIGKSVKVTITQLSKKFKMAAKNDGKMFFFWQKVPDDCGCDLGVKNSLKSLYVPAFT